MKVVIIDDEADAVESLVIIVSEYCKGIDIAGTAHSALDGMKLIYDHQPDLVFLDVEMPGGNGFDLLSSMTDRNFQVIFTTAYQHYAIQAIKANAIDYLMKPIDIDELIQAVENCKQQLDKDQSPKNTNLLETLNKGKLSKIPIAIRNEYLMLDIEDIQYIKSDGSYSNIYTEKEKYLTSKNLKHFESLLASSDFIRVSNSYLINLNMVKKYLREDGGVLELKNNVKISVTRNRREALKKRLGI